MLSGTAGTPATDTKPQKAGAPPRPDKPLKKNLFKLSTTKVLKTRKDAQRARLFSLSQNTISHPNLLS